MILFLFLFLFSFLFLFLFLSVFWFLFRLLNFFPAKRQLESCVCVKKNDLDKIEINNFEIIEK